MAIAGHVRMVHHASKKRQDDVVFLENATKTPYAGDKVEELAKTVPRIWLAKCLATTKRVHVVYVSCSIHSAQCRIALGMHHELLSRIRDLLKA